MRIYLPATTTDLAADRLTARAAHAVTPRWRAANPGDDEEDGEMVALLHAAADSVDLVAAGGSSAVPVRVVVAADVGDAVDAGEPDLPTSVDAPEVEWRHAVSIHVDDADDAAARTLVRAAADGDDDAVDQVADLDLLWFDVSERDALRAWIQA